MRRTRDYETDLERRLSAERPRAPDDLIDRLTGLIERPVGSWPAPASKIALIAGVTAAVVLSLWVAGAIGSATGSVHSAGRAVYDPAPFSVQQGVTVPICVQGQATYVPVAELLAYFLHGGRPVSACVAHPG
jgi:hypothetical protein